MNRIPFGHETKLEILASTCPACNAQEGCYHEYGCPLESCPQCGGRLLRCHCKALDIPTAFRWSHAVAQRLTRGDVHRITDRARAEGCRPCNRSYEEQGAFVWIIANCPPEMKQEMEDMAFDILGAKKKGDYVVVPLDKAAEALGMTEDEAAPLMAALEAECLCPGWEDGTGKMQ